MAEKGAQAEPQLKGAGTSTANREPYPERKLRADYYFDVHLQGQRRWYSTRAGRHKRMSNALAILVIVAGTAVTVVQIFRDEAWVPIATAVLGAVVVLAKGLERIGRYGETWMAYRKASEAMQHQYRLYVNNAGDFASEASEEEAYRTFVERVEQVIGEEVSQFWQAQARTQSKGGEPPPRSPPSADA